ncbi:hypothetical protein NC651_019332 [Populus alba x Populus x berolinensis]|nr:hypothetical protein NC651_019332 [Populus alba x Populus x berolinensis]
MFLHLIKKSVKLWLIRKSLRVHPQSQMLLVMVGEGDLCQERLMLEKTFPGLVGVCPGVLFPEGGLCLGLLALEAIS